MSFRIDWFDLLAVQGTLKSLLQHHSSKASVLQKHWLLLENSLMGATDGSFPMSQFFTSGGQSIGVSVSASVLPMNIQD